MKCDIITPTFNRPNLLQRAIKSVLAQTSPDWEHWIYDDSSDYDIKSIVEKFVDPRIHFVQGPKLTDEERFKKFSPSVARNILFEKSKNELIAYLDDDNYFWPKAIKTAIDYFTKFSDRDVIYGRLTYSNKDTEKLPREKRKSRMFKFGLLDIGQVIHRRKCLEWTYEKFGSYFPELVKCGPEAPFHQRLIKKYQFYPLKFFLVNKWKHPFMLQRLVVHEKRKEERRRE